jgi:DNA-binding response OmpR family regulator
MKNEPVKVLMVEDDVMLSTMLALNFKKEGFDITVSASFKDALLKFKKLFNKKTLYQMVILDVSLPDGNGLDLLRLLKKEAPAMPVLILSASASEFDRVSGLDLGADDYLCKPFSVNELRSRLNAILRRCGGRAGETETPSHGTDGDKK